MSILCTYLYIIIKYFLVVVVFVIYKVCFQKLFWLVITVFDNVLNPPLWAFWTLKSKKPLPPISENLLLTSAATLATKIRHKTVR